MGINSFIKGGQTISQNTRMFFNIFWKVIFTFISLWILILSFLIYIKTNETQRDLFFTYIEAKPFVYIYRLIDPPLKKLGLDNTKKQSFKFDLKIKTPDGSIHNASPEQVIYHLISSAFIQRMEQYLYISILESFIVSLVLTIIITKLLMIYGKSISTNKLLRGIKVCTPNELNKLVQKNGKDSLSEIKIANIKLPKNAETQHIWINGTTGAGKTVTFSDMLSQIRDKKRRAIVYDIMGTYVGRFYRPEKDIILNPFDERSPSWNPWVECTNSQDYEMLAASQIPKSGGRTGEDPFWKDAARSLYAATLERLARDGRTDNHTLLRYLLTSDLENLRELLANSAAESLVSKDLEKTALSVKAILNNYIKGLRFLDDSCNVFSIRKWVEKEEDSWIFITSRPDIHETLMPLISAWYDTAITAALSLKEDKERRIYFALDELPTLEYLSSLKKGMSLGRQKGLSFILGTQDLSQLQVNYGVDNTKTIIGNANNKLILRTSSDAENISNIFSKSEYEENTESVSYGVTDNRDGVSISTHRNVKNTVLASELQNLDNLEGYVKVAGNYPIAKVKLQYVNYEEKNERYLQKKIQTDLMSASENNHYVPIDSDDLTKQKKQGELYEDKREYVAKEEIFTKEANYGQIKQELDNANVPTSDRVSDSYRL